MKGFLNLGQTCYFNAAVQCLVFAPNCTNYLLEGAETNDVNPKRKLAGALAHEFAQLVREYWSSGAEGDVAHVEPLFVAFCKACKGFKVGEQHDAHEAMVCMLDKIHEGLSRMKPGDLAVSKQAGVSGSAWVSDLKSETSIVSEVFRGQVQVRVSGPGYESVTYDHFTSISLAITESSNLMACVQRFMAPETIPNYNESESGKRMTVTMYRTFTYLPRVLLVHLKRFDGKGGKVDKFVDYPFELSLGVHAPGDVVAPHYQLCAVCLHRGTADSGHYAACCEVHDKWFLLDDQLCTPLDDINHVIQRDAYILMYKRMA